MEPEGLPLIEQGVPKASPSVIRKLLYNLFIVIYLDLKHPFYTTIHFLGSKTSLTQLSLFNNFYLYNKIVTL